MKEFYASHNLFETNLCFNPDVLPQCCVLDPLQFPSISLALDRAFDVGRNKNPLERVSFSFS